MNFRPVPYSENLWSSHVCFLQIEERSLSKKTCSSLDIWTQKQFSGNPSPKSSWIFFNHGSPVHDADLTIKGFFPTGYFPSGTGPAVNFQRLGPQIHFPEHQMDKSGSRAPIPAYVMIDILSSPFSSNKFTKCCL